ncbi:MAG: hypothetical protein ACOVRN_09125 [Flavobacterium sp.]
MSIYFASFGGPSASYHAALQRICSEANQFNLFTKILGYTDIYLKNDKEFWNKHGNFVSTNPRGYGYWLWKSYLCKKLLTTINDGDIIVYADAGCTMNLQGKQRLLEYIEMCKTHESGIVSFQLTHPEQYWSKNDICQYLDASQTELSSGQLVGGIFVIRKCKAVVDLVDRWYETGSNYNLIDDSPSITPNIPEFRENRHDQSIWSILRKQHGSIILPDETYFLDWNKIGKNYPIWATRKRG